MKVSKQGPFLRGEMKVDAWAGVRQGGRGGDRHVCCIIGLGRRWGTLICPAASTACNVAFTNHYAICLTLHMGLQQQDHSPLTTYV